VEATQGKQERETVLGDGDNRTTYQTFKLPKAPLTYVNAPGERPPEVPKLEIRVNDRLWTRIPSLFGHGPKEELYIVREDANGNSWIQFGDGKTGARLPSGVRNVVALYRTGTGAFGELKPETTPQPGGRLALLDKVRLPGIASGGTQPETGDNARAAAPGKIQSLDRLVSLRDFECEALGIAGVAKVTGAWDLVDNVPAVVLTVLMESGREKEVGEVQLTLNRYNRCRGPQRFPIVVRLGERRYVYADIQLGLDPTYREDSVKLEVRKSLGIAGEEGNGCNGEGGLFGLSQRSFGQSEYANRIEGVVQNVAGIIWTKVTAYGPLDPGEDPTALLLPTEPRPLHDTVGCDSLEILCLFTTHLQLTTVKEKPAEVC
jgi:predicted phage baseplate assembly protein